MTEEQKRILREMIRDGEAAGLYTESDDKPVRRRSHNHVTRDVKPKGKCPACDRIYYSEESIVVKVKRKFEG